MIVPIDGQVIESLSARAWQIERRDFLQGPPRCLCYPRCAKSKNQGGHREQNDLLHQTPRQCTNLFPATGLMPILLPDNQAGRNSNPAIAAHAIRSGSGTFQRKRTAKVTIAITIVGAS